MVERPAKLTQVSKIYSNILMDCSRILRSSSWIGKTSFGIFIWEGSSAEGTSAISAHDCIVLIFMSAKVNSKAGGVHQIFRF